CYSGPVADDFIRRNDLIVQPLMIPFEMVMHAEIFNRIPYRMFAEEDHSFQASFLDRSDKPLRMRIQVRTSRWQFHGFDSRSTQYVQKFACVQWVAIMNEISLIHEKTIDDIRQVGGDLPHPQPTRPFRNSTDLYPPSRNIHEEEHHETRQSITGPALYCEEIGRDDLIPMAFQELFPGRLFGSFRCGLDALPLNIGNRIPRNRITQISQCTLNPPIP